MSSIVCLLLWGLFYCLLHTISCYCSLKDENIPDMLYALCYSLPVNYNTYFRYLRSNGKHITKKYGEGI